MSPTAELRRLVDATAAGRVLPGVRRCLLRVESPAWPTGLTLAASTVEPSEHPAERSAFRIASVTKVVTATTLLTLCDRSRCRLDDSIARHLPADLVDRVHVSGRTSNGAAITLRRLLDHTSGLRDGFGHPLIQAAVRDGGGRWRFIPQDLVDLAIASGPPPFPPGAGRAYTDTGFVLAGLVIEALTRGPLHQAYRDLVLDPAGMDDTWLESSDDPPRHDRVLAHEFDGRDISAMDPTVDWAGGGLVSTAADLAAMLHALRDGRLVRAATLREMTGWRPGPAGYYDDYGLGLGRYRIDDAQLIGHHGVWGAFAFWSPELEATITGTVSTGRIDRRALLAAVVRVLAR